MIALPVGFAAGWVAADAPPQWVSALFVLVALIVGLAVGGGFTAHHTARELIRAHARERP